MLVCCCTFHDCNIERKDLKKEELWTDWSVDFERPRHKAFLLKDRMCFFQVLKTRFPSAVNTLRQIEFLCFKPDNKIHKWNIWKISFYLILKSLSMGLPKSRAEEQLTVWGAWSYRTVSSVKAVGPHTQTKHLDPCGLTRNSLSTSSSTPPFLLLLHRPWGSERTYSTWNLNQESSLKYLKGFCQPANSKHVWRKIFFL